jgi:hypothetical protein
LMLERELEWPSFDGSPRSSSFGPHSLLGEDTEFLGEVPSMGLIRIFSSISACLSSLCVSR